MSNDNSIKLNKYKISHLFKNIRKLNGGKNLIARKLCISPMTLDEYLRKGQEFLDKFEEKLEPMYEIDIDAIDEELLKTKNNYVEEFLEQDIGNNIISDKNKNAYDVYFLNIKENMKENIIYDYQKEIINNLSFSEDKKEDEKIKLLIMFKLIYDRGQMSLDEELLYLKNKYAKSSNRNVAIVVKELERRNSEDFGDKKVDNKKITVNQQFNSFAQLSIEYDRLHGLINNNDNNNLIEGEIIEDNIDD